MVKNWPRGKGGKGTPDPRPRNEPRCGGEKQGGKQNGFVTRKDETGRARVGQPWKSWRLSWELVVDRMWQGESHGPHWVSGLETG